MQILRTIMNSLFMHVHGHILVVAYCKEIFDRQVEHKSISAREFSVWPKTSSCQTIFYLKWFNGDDQYNFFHFFFICLYINVNATSA